MAQHCQEFVLRAVGGPKRFFGAFTLGNIPGDLRHSNDRSVFVDYGRDGERKVHQTSILATAHRFVVIDAVSASNAFNNGGLFVGSVRRDGSWCLVSTMF